MNFYWVYDLPNWLFGLLVVALSVTIGLSGMLVLRSRIRGLHGGHSHNEIVSVFFASMAVFYGVAVGLFSVGAWQTYTDVESKVALEAATLASLYRDVSHFAEPARSEAQARLGTYTRNIFDQVWPQQRKGIVTYSNDALLSSFYDTMVNYEPSTEMQKEVSAESLRQFNRLIELRRLRLQNVTVGLPRTMWTLVILGAIVTLASTWFFDVRSLMMHSWLTVLLAILLGMIIHLLAAMDNPFRGDYCVSPKPFQMVYDDLMAPRP